VVILGFVLGMGLLTGPLLLGEPAGIYVLPTEIYRLIDGVTPATTRARARCRCCSCSSCWPW
jgi:hypothetical protein